MFHGLPNDLRRRILRNSEILEESLNFVELLPNAQSSRNENFVSTSKNLLKNRN